MFKMQRCSCSGVNSQVDEMASYEYFLLAKDTREEYLSGTLVTGC